MAVETRTVNGGVPRVGDESPAETITALRRVVEVKEGELDSLKMRIKTSKSGRASVRLAASRFMQKADDDVVRKPSSTPEMPKERSAAVSSLLSRWNAGIEKQIEKTKVDVKGDVRGTSGKYNNKDQSIARPNAAEAPSRRARGPTGPEELEVEDDEKVPEWAVNQTRKVVKKVNARASVRDVDVGRMKGSIATRRTEVDTSSVRETPVKVGGGVAAALAKWGKMADEEAEKLERVNLVEQARRDEEKRKKEHAAEQERIREEAEKKLREEREKKEAAERAERAKREAEEKARRLAEEREQAKKAREEEIRMLRQLPEDEPSGVSSTDLIDWLNNRIKLLDILIAEAQAELNELEKNL